MATLRRAGFGSVFEVENETVGIGTTGTATNTVQVLGETKASLALVTGLSTLTTYQGFVDSNAEFGNSNVDINSQSGTMGNIEICHGDFNVSSASTLTSSVNQLTLTDSFSVPTGNTDSRIHCQTAGSMRFNEDLGTLEFYTGDEWRTVNSFKDTGNRGRVIYAGGNPGSSPSTKSNIEFLNATTQGNTSSFGDLTEAVRNKAGGSSSTRGIFSSGASPNSTSNTDVIEYVTIPSEGNSIDFGDSTAARRNPGGASNSTRFLTAGGYVSSASNIIDYVQINTLGDALDFGDLIFSKYYPVGTSSPIRAVFSGGTTPGNTETMSFVSFASLGNAVNFGELSSGGGTFSGSSASDGVRGVLAGVYNPSATYLSTIEYLTIASEGNTTHFGNLTVGRSASGSSGGTRGIFAGGSTGSVTNIIDFIQIATTGNAEDFGDTGDTLSGMASASDAHGGLGGF